MIQFRLNGQPVTFDAEADMPLLWVLRDLAGLTGTKFGCGMAMCGACTVLLDGQATRSCVTPASTLEGKSVTTIEGAGQTPIGQVVQRAWIAEQVPQCGYCQSGQIMNACGLLRGNAHPTDAEIGDAMTGNICRCGTYPMIRLAIKRASSELAKEASA